MKTLATIASCAWLMIAPACSSGEADRSQQIAVGYGLETILPDVLCHEILDQQMIPRFRENDLAGGIEAGVDALLARLR